MNEWDCLFGCWPASGLAPEGLGLGEELCRGGEGTRIDVEEEVLELAMGGGAQGGASPSRHLEKGAP